MRYGCPPVSGVHRGSPPGIPARPTRTVKGRGDAVLGELAPQFRRRVAARPGGGHHPAVDQRLMTTAQPLLTRSVGGVVMGET